MVDPSPPDFEEEGPLPAGTRLGKYQIVRLLGAGGMGSVYEATHVEIGKRVAVKTLSPAVAAIPGARQRFLREAQLTSRLNHPHIVDLSDMGTEGRIAYLVMELLSGEDLAHRLERTGPMLPHELVDIMLPVCSALVAAHDAGIVHRDLKPQNIFLASSVRGVAPKVLDFGISKSSDTDAVSSLTSTGSVIGTPHYLAPEQIKDARSASAASDQYSLGVILYKCLTNQNPFEGDSLFSVLHAIVTVTPVPLRTRRADLPAGLERVVERAMNPLPWERFASVRELGRALLPYASPKARAIWEELFTAGDPAVAPEPELPRGSHTMPMPTPERPVRFASEVPAAKAERLDSGTLSPAVTSSASVGFGAAPAPRRGRMILWTLVGAALAVGGFVVFSRGARAPEAPPSAAATPPVAPVAAPPPLAPVAAPPAAAAEEARLQAKRQEALDEANAREAQARAEAAAKEAAAKRDAEAKIAAAKEAEARAAAKEAEASARRRSSASARHGSRARPETPAAAPRNLNPNGAPVID